MTTSTVVAEASVPVVGAPPLASIIPVTVASSSSLAAPVLIFLPTGKSSSVVAVIPVTGRINFLGKVLIGLVGNC